VAAVFDVKVKDKDVAATCHDSPESRAHTDGMQCSAWPGLDQRRAGCGCNAMEWDGILREGKRRHLLSGGDGEPAEQ
jgi:hypothetical protein